MPLSIARQGAQPRLGDLLAPYQRHLAAEAKSAKTISIYRRAVDDLLAFLDRNGLRTEPAAIDREALDTFMSEYLARHAATTASICYRALQQCFRWLEQEGYLAENPFRKMRPPQVPEAPVPILVEDELRRLLRTCERRKDFRSVRDYAILRVFIDGGCRLGEVAGLRWSPDDPERQDVMLDEGLLRVVGKGSRTRFVALGPRTVASLDRYLAIRTYHPSADLPWLWLSGAKHSRFTESGIGQMVGDRALEAGIGHVHAHQLRHTFAHRWMTAGGGEQDLMRLAGWRSPQMLARYGASAAAERAVAAHHRMRPAEDL